MLKPSTCAMTADGNHTALFMFGTYSKGNHASLSREYLPRAKETGAFFENTSLHNWVGIMLKIKHAHKERHPHALRAWSAIPQGSKQTLYSGI